MLSITGKGYSKTHSENPFYEEPPPRAHYYPTPQKQLPEAERQVALSPQRPQGKTQQNSHEAAETKFLSGSHAIKPLDGVQTYHPKSPSSSNFDESWPDSERASSPSLAGMEEGSRLDPLPCASVRKHVQPAFTSSPKYSSVPNSMPHTTHGTVLASMHSGQHFSASHFMSTGGAVPDVVGKARRKNGERKPALSTVRGKDDTKGAMSSMEPGSVLQKYIERFRHGAPMSREQRLQAEGGQHREFWWLESSPPTPNSTSTPKEKEGRSLPFTCQGQNPLTMENLQKRDNLEMATVHLQEKAERLLNSAQSIGSSEPIVSTVGLGSTGSDITGSSFSEPAVRPAFLPCEGGLYPGAGRKAIAGQSHPPDHAEDILYKWRLQRKLDVAREGRHIPTSSTQIDTPASVAEKEIHSRLAAFKEKLSRHGSVVSAQLAEAKVEKIMKQVQSVMDTAVQTSPIKATPPSHDATNPPSWSCNRSCYSETDKNVKPIPHTSTEKDTQTAQSTVIQFSGDLLAQSASIQQPQNAMTYSADRQSAHHSTTCAVPAGKQTSDSALTHHESKSAETAVPEAVQPSQGSNLSASENLGEVESIPESSKEVMSGVQYRQYLEAEKPHVHDGGDSPVGPASSQRRQERKDVASRLSGPNSKGMMPPFAGSESQTASGGGGDASGDVFFTGTKPSSHDASNVRKDDALGIDHDLVDSSMPNHIPEVCQQRKAMSTQQRAGGEKPRAIPPPQYSSSPARTPLSSAIGQVVKDRMFDQSVMSSMDSLSSLPYAAASPLPPTHGDLRPETGCESDGEFEGDPLLQVLRLQRQQHETQLRFLDSLLTERDVS